MPRKRKTTVGARGTAKKRISPKGNYVVRVLNVSTGAEKDLRLSGAERQESSLWPVFLVYVIGFGVLGLSFIANTLRMYSLFAILLTLSVAIVVGAVISRTLRNRL